MQKERGLDVAAHNRNAICVDTQKSCFDHTSFVDQLLAGIWPKNSSVTKVSIWLQVPVRNKYQIHSA